MIVSGVFASFYARIVPVDDLEIYMLQGSPSQAGLFALAPFGSAFLNPLRVNIDAGAPGAVLTPAYFAAEADVIARLRSAGAQGGFVDASSFTALSFFNGAPVSLATAAAYLNSSSPAYATEAGVEWRAIAASRINPDASASSVNVATLVDPVSVSIVPFIDAARNTLAGATFRAYLLGGYTYSLDSIRYIYSQMPTYLGCLVVIIVVSIGATFRSVALIVRLVTTLAATLALVFGLMELVYAPSPVQAAFTAVTPWLSRSTGVAWLVPFACLSILVGLGLDYDVYLILSVCEFRELGWSDRAAASLAVGRTAGVITTAGVIMTISFGGLLVPKILVVNQYGFALFVGVLIDTFVIRPIVVPAILSASPREAQWNWAPHRMPAPALSETDEQAALAAGCDEPSQFGKLPREPEVVSTAA